MTSAAEGQSARVGSSQARVVFFGSGTFAIPALESLLAMPTVQVVGVIAGPDRPAGRRAEPTPTPVAAFAVAHGLPVLRPERVRAPETIAAIAALGPDLGILADYGRIIPPDLLDVPRRGILNIHPSLLPRHRGATPIPATILAADSEAGVTVIAMDAGLDSGPIVASEAWPLRGDEDSPGLEDDAARRGAQLLARVVPGWLDGSIDAVPQDDSLATLTWPLRREDGRLDGGRPATELERRIRAYRPWPGTFMETTAGRLGILEADVGEVGGGEPGTLVADGEGLALAAQDGRLRLLRVQPAGGRPMSSAELRRGRGRELVGTRVIAPPVGESPA